MSDITSESGVAPEGPHGVNQGPSEGEGEGKRELPPPLTKAQRLVLQERALELSLQGYSYNRIADLLSNEKAQALLGIAPYRKIPKVMAFRLVDKALAPLREERDQKAERKKRRELLRLDLLQLAHWEQRKNPRSALVVLKISERRSKLEGWDAPQRVKHEGQVAAPGLPLALLTDEELDQYEKLAAAVAARMNAGEGGPSPEPEPQDDEE